jgi:hypothetical protein
VKAIRHLLLLLTFGSALAVAQAPAAIGSQIVCGSCRITLERVATLGNPQDTVLLSWTSIAAVDSRGRFVVGNTFNDGQIALYDPSGRLLRVAGRLGAGPGEFGPVVHRIVVTAGDSIHILEGNRHTTMAPGLGAVASLRQLPIQHHDALPLPGGQWLLQYLPVGASGADHPLHVVGSQGSVVRSFGSNGQSLGPDQRAETVRVLAPARSGEVWVGYVNEYRIDRWTLNGRMTASVVRNADWFRPWTGRLSGAPMSVPPRPALLGLHEDASGNLWVTSLVASTQWQPQASHVPSRTLDRTKTYDTVLEVIDLNRRGIIATFRHPGQLYLLGNDMAYSRREDSDGIILIDVWRVRITGR